MQCAVCHYEEDNREEFPEIATKMIRIEGSFRYTIPHCEEQNVVVDVFACPKCGTLQISTY